MSRSQNDTQPAMTYPTAAQYARWKARAIEFDMSVSQFMQSMIEAGIKADKGFEVSLEYDETRHELREQRSDLKDELSHARERIATLEDRLHHGERETVYRYVERNPGATSDEIIQHVVDTVPARVNQHLEELEGDELRVDDGAFYTADAPGSVADNDYTR